MAVSNGTVLPEIGRELRLHLILSILMLFLVFVVGSVGNVLVVYNYYHSFSKTSSWYFVISLALYDLFICVVVVPLEVYDQFTYWVDSSQLLCRVFLSLKNSVILGSMWILLGIAMLTYVKICHPFFYVRQSTILIACCASLLLTLPLHVPLAEALFGIVPDNSTIPGIVTYACFKSLDAYGTTVDVVYTIFLQLFLVWTAIGLLFFYGLVFWRVHHQAQKLFITRRNALLNTGQITLRITNLESSATSDSKTSLCTCDSCKSEVKVWQTQSTALAKLSESSYRQNVRSSEHPVNREGLVLPEKNQSQAYLTQTYSSCELPHQPVISKSSGKKKKPSPPKKPSSKKRAEVRRNGSNINTAKSAVQGRRRYVKKDQENDVGQNSQDPTCVEIPAHTCDKHSTDKREHSVEKTELQKSSGGLEKRLSIYHPDPSCKNEKEGFTHGTTTTAGNTKHGKTSKKMTASQNLMVEAMEHKRTSLKTDSSHDVHSLDVLSTQRDHRRDTHLYRDMPDFSGVLASSPLNYHNPRTSVSKQTDTSCGPLVIGKSDGASCAERPQNTLFRGSISLGGSTLDPRDSFMDIQGKEHTTSHSAEMPVLIDDLLKPTNISLESQDGVSRTSHSDAVDKPFMMPLSPAATLAKRDVTSKADDTVKRNSVANQSNGSAQADPFRSGENQMASSASYSDCIDVVQVNPSPAKKSVVNTKPVEIAQVQHSGSRKRIVSSDSVVDALQVHHYGSKRKNIVNTDSHVDTPQGQHYESKGKEFVKSYSMDSVQFIPSISIEESVKRASIYSVQGYHSRPREKRTVSVDPAEVHHSWSKEKDVFQTDSVDTAQPHAWSKGKAVSSTDSHHIAQVHHSMSNGTDASKTDYIHSAQAHQSVLKGKDASNNDYVHTALENGSKSKGKPVDKIDLHYIAQDRHSMSKEKHVSNNDYVQTAQVYPPVSKERRVTASGSVPTTQVYPSVLKERRVTASGSVPTTQVHPSVSKGKHVSNNDYVHTAAQIHCSMSKETHVADTIHIAQVHHSMSKEKHVADTVHIAQIHHSMSKEKHITDTEHVETVSVQSSMSQGKDVANTEPAYHYQSDSLMPTGGKTSVAPVHLKRKKSTNFDLSGSYDHQESSQLRAQRKRADSLIPGFLTFSSRFSDNKLGFEGDKKQTWLSRLAREKLRLIDHTSLYMLLISTAYVLCYTPSVILFTAKSPFASRDMHLLKLFVFNFKITFVPAAMHPLVYFLFNRKFNELVKKQCSLVLALCFR